MHSGVGSNAATVVAANHAWFGLQKLYKSAWGVKRSIPAASIFAELDLKSLRLDNPWREQACFIATSVTITTQTSCLQTLLFVTLHPAHQVLEGNICWHCL